MRFVHRILLLDPNHLGGSDPTTTKSGNLGALLETISYAEGTSGPDGYNKWFGGRTDMDLSKMTINEVGAEMDRRNRTGENRYGKYASSAVGKYQMMAPEGCCYLGWSRSCCR